jgi:hypothetical protein
MNGSKQFLAGMLGMVLVALPAGAVNSYKKTDAGVAKTPACSTQWSVAGCAGEPTVKGNDACVTIDGVEKLFEDTTLNYTMGMPGPPKAVALGAGVCGNGSFQYNVECSVFCENIGHETGSCETEDVDCAGDGTDVRTNVGYCDCTGGDDIVESLHLTLPDEPMCTNKCYLLTATLHDAGGAPVDAHVNMGINLWLNTTVAGALPFYAEPTTCTTTTPNVTIPSGDAFKDFGFKYGTPGTYSITLQYPGLKPEVRQITVQVCPSPSTTPNPSP